MAYYLLDIGISTENGITEDEITAVDSYCSSQNKISVLIEGKVSSIDDEIAVGGN
jgi:hypothetical protein